MSPCISCFPKRMETFSKGPGRSTGRDFSEMIWEFGGQEGSSLALSPPKHEMQKSCSSHPARIPTGWLSLSALATAHSTGFSAWSRLSRTDCVRLPFRKGHFSNCPCLKENTVLGSSGNGGLSALWHVLHWCDAAGPWVQQVLLISMPCQGKPACTVFFLYPRASSQESVSNLILLW